MDFFGIFVNRDKCVAYDNFQKNSTFLWFHLVFLFFLCYQALRLMEELEKRFIKLFANGEKGMAGLKAFKQPASHRVTFFLGNCS